MVIVHGIGLSPFVRKVRVVLEEKGVAYEHDPVIPLQKTPEMLAKSPLGKIPYFDDGDFCISDSSVICQYLERTRPEPALYPSDPKDFARALWLEELADSKLADGCGTVFFQRIVRPNFLQEKTDEELVKKAVNTDLPPLFDYLETQVGEKVGVIGGRFSIADIAVASPVVNLLAGGEKIDSGRWPKLAKYIAAVHAYPSYKQVIDKDRAALQAA